MTISRRIIGACAIVLLSFFTITTVHAESAIWTNTSTTKICMPSWGPGGSEKSKTYVNKYGGPCTATRLMSRNVSIEYNVRVVNETKGTQIACGSTVTKGDRLSFEFVPHHYTDISWNGVGYSNDTPYGDWIVSAGPPAGSPHSCLPKDQVNEKMYVPLSVAPPTKSFTGQENLGCGSLNGGVMKCTPTEVGSNTIVFSFAPTSGSFYGRTIVVNNEIAGSTDDCLGSNSPMRTYTVSGTDCRDQISSGSQFRSCQFAKPTSNAYTLPVPERSISCRINVIDTTGDPPASPTINATGGACVAGTPHTLSLRATDPDGDKVRFLIDWNNDGSVDAHAPSSGYADSNSVAFASRTFTAGSKTVKVMAEDEEGLTSGWTSTIFVCTGGEGGAALTGEDTVNLGNDVISPEPSVNDLSLRALPSLVRTGATTKVHWSSQNMASCTVIGSNGDSWDDLASPVNGEVSGAIRSLVTYTLTCRAGGDTFTKTATVNVLPSWVEK